MAKKKVKLQKKTVNKRVAKNKEKTVPFTKIVGSGNDFVIIDLREVSIKRNWNKIAKQICSRKWNIANS